MDVARLRFGDCLLDRVTRDVLGECRIGGDRHAQEDRAPETEPEVEGGASAAAAATSSTEIGARDPARAGVETGHLVDPR